MRIRRRRLRDALVAVGCLVAAVDPFGEPAGRARFAAALFLLATGSALHFWSKGCLEQNQRLVTAGPYRFTRNPFYLANLLIDLGLCALIGRGWVALPYVVVWWLAYHETIRREEARLAELFGDAFARYVASVARLIPTGHSLPRAEAAGRFALDNPALAQGSEYARIAGVWVAAATIVAWDWIRAHGLAVFAPEQTVGLGLVTLVAVAWVMKLALAEVFRRKRTALVPLAGEPRARRLVTFGLVVGLYLAARFFGGVAIENASGTTAAAVALGAMFGAVALLPRAKSSVPMRDLLHAGLAIAIVVYGMSRGVLWVASLPLLWVCLVALDDAVSARASVEGAAEAPGESESIHGVPRLWQAFPAIAAGALGTLVLVAIARTIA